MSTGSSAPHSADQFTASRDLWWHDDYLALVGRRLALHRCRRVLELGAGVGHWTARILPLLAPDAEVVATDRAPAWVARLGARFEDDPRVAARLADATALAGLAGPYDLITCQTLLLHIADVPSVIRHAAALLSPGGRMLLAEPNNFLNRLPASSAADVLTPDEYAELARMWWAFEQGRRRLGLGSERIAEQLPGDLVAAGLAEVQVFVNDRTFPAFPPYDRPETSSYGVEADAEAVAAEEAETHRLASAGGLGDTEFATAWALHLRLERAMIEACRAGRLSHSGNAGSLFLFTALKPAPRGA